jgi:hypothetical protein
MKSIKRPRRLPSLALPALPAALVLMSAAPAGAERLPVSSRDDGTAVLANRISAVADVVATMDGRLQRIQSATPPSPILPPSPIYPALLSVQDASAGLLASAAGIACGHAGAASGGETIADDDGRAEDTSSEGLLEQLGAVATVLGQANARLAGSPRSSKPGLGRDRGGDRRVGAGGRDLQPHRPPARKR